MTSNLSKDNNEPLFVTPDPSSLQSEENRAEMREQYDEAERQETDPNGPFYVADEVPNDVTLPFELDTLSNSDDDAPPPGFDADAIAQSGGESTSSQEEREIDRLRDRQIGNAFRSGG